MVQQPDGAPADVVLLDRIASGDAGAVSELYDRHHRLLYGLVLRILRDRGDAEEALQEVFLSVWTRAQTYNATLGPPVAWLVRIARNRAIDRLRARGVRERLLEAPLDARVEDTPETGAAQLERQRLVARALDRLPPEQRMLIEHAYFLGLTHAELAARFDLPLGTVKTRIRSGLLALRQHVQEAVV